MGSQVSAAAAAAAAALHLAILLTLLFGVSCGPDLGHRETDGLCTENGCFMVYFRRDTFLNSWKACRKMGGDLATIKHQQDAASIAALFSTLDLRYSRTKVQVWIGLQRLPRQCSGTRPLRGFSWTTGDQDTEFTNWQREDTPSTCAVSRCVAIGYNTLDPTDNFRWLDGGCSVSVDGFLCHYGFRGMCPPLLGEGAGKPVYSTPFNLVSTLLTHVPFGSSAVVACPAGPIDRQSVVCTQKDDGSVGWSRASPLCSNPPSSQNWCERDNGGCEHYCTPAGATFNCKCADGYKLGDDGRSCELFSFCDESKCEFECVPLPDGHRCACPDGYMLAPDERSCLDVDECLQSPCEQLCVNAPGTFECRCRDGYQLDELGDCEDVDECVNEPCDHACENTAGSYRCHCHLGYSPAPEDLRQCQDDDECLIPDTCEQMCVNYEGAYECFCMEGYQLLSDSSCQKTADGDSPVTPSFSLEPPWEPVDYKWSVETNTDWPPPQEPPLHWLTEAPRVPDDDVIWVTRSPQEDTTLNSKTLQAMDEDVDAGGAYLLEWGQRSTYHTTPPPTTKTSTDPDWYEEEEEEEETTTVLPLFSTSTVSSGAWNWWGDTIQQTGNPKDSVRDHEGALEEQDSLRGSTELPEEGQGEQEEEDAGKITRSQEPTVPSQLTPSTPSSSGAGGNDSVLKPTQEEEQGEHQEGGSWLLVGLLVPLCIFVVVVAVLAIVYCSRFAVQPRQKNASDCYHWISGAHDKQGAALPPAGGGKTNV